MKADCLWDWFQIGLEMAGPWQIEAALCTLPQEEEKRVCTSEAIETIPQGNPTSLTLLSRASPLFIRHSHGLRQTPDLSAVQQ